MKLREKGESSSSFERMKNNSRVFAFVAKLGRLQAVFEREKEREREQLSKRANNRSNLFNQTYEIEVKLCFSVRFFGSLHSPSPFG